MAATPRTLHVRCATWDQVTTFYTRKLRQGRVLSMKVPFSEEVGAGVTLGLELPNGLVIAIDGKVLRASPIEGAADGSKTWIEIELSGFTEDVIGRIKEMASGAQPIAVPPPPPPALQRRSQPLLKLDELPADERALFQHLSAELRRLRQLPVHEVLGVAHDAGADEIRRGWMTLVRRQHPDLVARRNAPAISHLAEELTIVANRAYDRLRAALVAEDRGVAFGPAISSPTGWLVGFDALEQPSPSVSGARASRGALGPEPGARTATPRAATSPPVAPPSNPNPQGGEAFELRARAMLGDGDPSNAQEVLAAALCVYPRSRPLRSLYYVASAMAALDKGEIMLATSQLETALAHHEQCTEAAVILEHVRKHGKADADITRRLFR
jgi:hypothetical protein